MTKLSNGVEYANQNLQPAFAEYLLSNGFLIDVAKNEILFHKATVKIYLRGTSIDVFIFDTQLIDWKYRCGFVGIDILDINGFILIMHAIGIQNVTKFVGNAATLSEQHGKEAGMIVKWLYRSLQISPVNKLAQQHA